MFSVEAQDLITEMEKKKKVRITAWLYPSWLLSSLFRLPNRSASAGRLTKKQCDFQKAGWQRGQDEEHSSTAVCYHFPFTNGVNLEGRERGHSGKQVPLCHFKKKKKGTEWRQGRISVLLRTSSMVNISSVKLVSSALSLLSTSCEAVFMPGHWVLSTEEQSNGKKKKKPFHNGDKILHSKWKWSFFFLQKSYIKHCRVISYEC